MQDRTAFLILRSSADLAQAKAEVGALLQHIDVGSSSLIKGIWVDDQIGRSLPTAVRVNRNGEVQTIAISDTVSISGVWALCWLDGVQMSEEELADALFDKAGALCSQPTPLALTLANERLPELLSA